MDSQEAGNRGPTSVVAIIESFSYSRQWTGTSLQLRLMWGVFQTQMSAA